ncbi:MAG: recombinase family protein [Oscillospiraceae bacterium]|nr:recombinase family protein [Oscillospiraceae bacterium]
METGIYVRVSTEEQAQEGYSIRAQEQKLKDFARIKDWSIFKIYTDEGISGKNITERPAINEMIADIRSGLVQNVVVYKIDRLTRSTADLIYLVDLFNEQDCAFNSLSESIDTQTASGRMFLKIIGIFAEFERENIIERTKLGLDKKVKEGYSLCTNVSSYGYTREKGQKIQTINEQEAEIVKDIFDMYVSQGMSLMAIAKHLNILKIPTKKGFTWTGSNVGRLLSNHNFIGNVRHHVRSGKSACQYEGQHEAIISEELFDEAQKLLEKNLKAGKTKKPREDNYFCGILICAKCGRRLASHCVYNKSGDETTSYVGGFICPNKDVNACDASSMSLKKVEKAFQDYIDQIFDFRVADKIELQEQEQARQDQLAQITAYQEKLRQLDSREREVLNRYVDNEIEFEEYTTMKTRIRRDKSFVQSELDKLQLPEPEKATICRGDVISDLKKNWQHLSITEKRQFLVKFVQKIVIVNEKEPGKHCGTVKVLHVEFQSN